LSKADAKRKKLHQRELENLERGLRRGSLELVLDALPELSEAAYAAKLSVVRALLMPKLEAACRGRDASALQLWLRALGREPKLFERLAVNDDELIWTLLWTALRAQNYSLSAQLWGSVAERLRDRTPASARAIDALIATRGHPDPELVPVMQRAADERLGLELVRPGRASTATPMPTDPGDVEPRLVEVRASEPWSSFAATAREWLARAPAVCAAQLCVTVAEFALLELGDAPCVATDREQQSSALVLAADRRFTELSKSETASPALQARLDQALALTLRTAFARLCAAPDAGASADWIAATIRQALRLPRLRTAIVSALSQSVACSKLVPFVRLLQELHAEGPSPTLWVRAALALDLAAERRVRLGRGVSDASWDWVTSNLERHLAAPRELASAIATLSDLDRHRLFEMLEELLEPERAVDFIFVLWNAAEGRQREPLIRLGRTALALAADQDFCEDCGKYHFLEEGSRHQREKPLFSRAEELLSRLAPLLLVHDELVLKLVLGRANGRREQRAVLDRYLAPGVPIDNYLGALEHAGRLGLPRKPFREQLRARFSGQLSPLTRGFELALRDFGPRSTLSRELAELLVDAADRERPELLSADTQRRLQFARVLVRRSKKAPRATKQLSLPLETTG